MGRRVIRPPGCLWSQAAQGVGLRHHCGLQHPKKLFSGPLDGLTLSITPCVSGEALRPPRPPAKTHADGGMANYANASRRSSFYSRNVTAEIDISAVGLSTWTDRELRIITTWPPLDYEIKSITTGEFTCQIPTKCLPQL